VSGHVPQTNDGGRCAPRTNGEVERYIMPRKSKYGAGAAETSCDSETGGVQLCAWFGKPDALVPPSVRHAKISHAEPVRVPSVWQQVKPHVPLELTARFWTTAHPEVWRAANGLGQPGSKAMDYEQQKQLKPPTSHRVRGPSEPASGRHWSVSLNPEISPTRPKLNFTDGGSTVGGYIILHKNGCGSEQ
jgi:hypothetical protein